MSFKFKLDSRGYLKNRESYNLEYKQNFHYGDELIKYCKTLVGMANNRGGEIIFGVQNKPHIPTGLKDDKFIKVDSKKIDECFEKYFSIDVEWACETLEFESKTFGELSIKEFSSKPIICSKNYKNILKEGAIYFRYRGRTTEIRYTELVNLLNKEKEKERILWMHYIQKMTKVGIKNVGILDSISGKITGSSGSFFISEDLLPKIKFINTGKFTETEGSPTLRLIGDVEPIPRGLIKPIHRVIEPHLINTPDIINAFLENIQVIKPLNYLKQICFENTAYLPIYHFISKEDKPIPEVIKILSSINSNRQGKHKLLERLKNEKNFKLGSLNTGSTAANKLRRYRKDILDKKVNLSIPYNDWKYFFRAVTHLKSDEIDIEFILPLMKQIFDKLFMKFKGIVPSTFRSAICHLDKLINFDKCHKKKHNKLLKLSGGSLAE